MWSLATIAHINHEIMEDAVDKEPVAITLEELEDMPPFPFPNVGPKKFPNWKPTEATWFCDKTGCGSNTEPALTPEQLKTALHGYIQAHPDHGFAIIEEGQFQCYLGAFAPKVVKKRRTRHGQKKQ